MNRYLKRYFSMVFCLSLLLALVYVPVSAQSYGYLTYTVTNGEATITDCDESITGELIIPAQIDGYPVTRIGEYAFSYCYDLGSVIIEEGITHIDKYAFFCCKSMTSVSLPDSLTELARCAFHSCSILKSVTIPHGITAIGERTFNECRALKNLSIPDSVTSIGRYAFYNTGLFSLVIPKGVTTIEDQAFGRCWKLKDIYFCGDAPTFGSQVFYNTTSNATYAYYHTGTDGWEETKSLKLGRTLTWKGPGHIVPEYTSDNNFTCTADGTKRGTCVACGVLDVQVDTGSAKHSFLYTSNADATCTISGTKTGICSICGFRETVSDPGSAYGHSYGAYTSNLDYTCTQDGTKSAVCQRCGKINTVADQGSATGHSFTDYIPNGNAGCTVDGTKTAKCDNCDEKDTQVDTGSAGHRYNNGQCTVCGALEITTGTLWGSITCFGSADDSITVTLYPAGTAEASRTLNTADNTYRMEDLPSGHYTLSISKKNHATRHYEPVVTTGEIRLDLSVSLIGDVNEDGTVNIADVAIIYAHSKGTAELTGYALTNADLNGDGSVDIADTAKVYAHTRGTDSLWN